MQSPDAPPRVLFADAVLHYCELLDFSLKQLAAVAVQADGTSATKTAESIHKDVLKLCEKLRVLETLSSSVNLDDRFIHRYPVCVRKTWKKMRVLFEDWLRDYGLISVLPVNRNGKSNQSTGKQNQKKESDSYKLLSKLHKSCNDFLKYQKTIQAAAKRVPVVQHDGSLDLADLTEFFADHHDFDYTTHPIDYLVTEAEFSIGLGRKERFLAHYDKKRFPTPVKSGRTKLYSLKAMNSWFRSLRKKDLCFDPIRVPKEWYPL